MSLLSIKDRMVSDHEGRGHQKELVLREPVQLRSFTLNREEALSNG